MLTNRDSADFRLVAFRAEAAALAAAVAGVTDADLARPSPCPPWTNAALLCHVIIAAGRVDQAIAAMHQAGDGPLVDARGYYRPDERFSPAVNADRIDIAAELAARLGTASAMRAELSRTTERTLTALTTASPDLEVATRHGDRMLLTEFLVTRVVELGVHGLDLAGGLGHRPWLTAPAAEVIAHLMLPAGSSSDDLSAALGCDQAGLIALLTGRARLSAAARSVLDRAGVIGLALG